jgi:DNA-binding winged helix-turn-helix (wHTH) protein
LTRFQFDQLVFDNADGTLSSKLGSASTTLRPQVAKLLLCLLKHSGQVVDRQTVCNAIWGERAVVDFESGLAAIVKDLRQSLERVGANPELVETVPRRGYRLRAEANVSERSASVAQARPSIRWPWIAAPLLIAAAVSGATLWLTAPDPHGQPPNQSLVILPFVRYGDLPQAPDHAEYLIADTFLARLWDAELDGLDLIGRSSVLPFAGRENVAAAVAEELDADLILEGDLIGDQKGWRVEARLLQLPGGRVIWSSAYGSMSKEQPMQIDQSAGALVEGLEKQWSDLRGLD